MFVLKNMDDYMMFEDYLEADMIIEMTRAFKVQVMAEIQKNLLPEDRQILNEQPLAELQFLQRLCIKEYLAKDENYYNEILQALEGNTKWSSDSTETYIECVSKDLQHFQISGAIKALLKEEQYVEPLNKKEQSKSKRRMTADV